MAKKPSNPRRSAPLFETLEPRLLLSAEGLGAVVADAGLDDDAELLRSASEVALLQVEDRDQSEIAALSPSRELIIIDPLTPNHQQMVDDLLAQAAAGREIDVVTLDPSKNGIDQIGDALAHRAGLDTLHIVSHGSAGSLQLGNTVLGFETMLNHAKDIQAWGDALSAEADVLLYGCDLAANADGQALVDSLSRLTGADVAASDDDTGHQKLGGDWYLEYKVGHVESEVTFTAGLLEDWLGTLDITTGLEAQLTFDAGQGAQDSSGNNLHGILGGDAAVDTTAASNQVGSGKLTLDGVDDYVDLDAHVATLAGLAEGTIGAWINFTSTADSTIFNLGDGPPNSYFAWLHVVNGNLRWDVSEFGSFTVSSSSTAAFNDGSWHHVAVTVDSSGTSIYVDGSELTGGDISFTAGSSSSVDFLDDVLGPVQSEIGGFDIGSGVQGEFTGLIDDFRLYDRALSASDITELYNFNRAPILADWYDINWAHRKAVTIDASQVSADHSEFPVLVRLSTDADLAAFAQADSDDILFTANDGTTKLAHEIEYFDAGTGELAAWVKTDLSGADDTRLYLYFGNASVGNQQDPANVWDANFQGVWHLNDSPTGALGEITDSTGGNDGTTHGGMNSVDLVTAKVGQGLDFDALDDHILIPDSANLDGTSDAATFEVWAWFQDAADGNHQIILTNSNRFDSAPNDGYEWSLRDPDGVGGTRGDLFFYPWGGADPNFMLGPNPIMDQTWHHLAVTLDYAAGDVAIYVDGVEISYTSNTLANWTSQANPADWLWGGNPDRSSRFFDGMMDEIRVSDVVRSQSWLQTTVNNQNNPSAFHALGGLETNPLTLTDVSENDANPAGDTVAAILASAGGDPLVDVDADPEGIAVIGVDDTNGTWQYDAGGGWTNFGGVSDSAAVLLDATATVRYVPDPAYTGTAGNLLFRAWDQTIGTSGDTGISITAIGTGGTRAFSVSSTTATLTVTGNVAPVVTLSGGPASFTEGGSAVLVDAGATVVDVDSPDFDGGILTVDVSANGTADDRLTIREQGPGVGNVSLSGSDVRYDFGSGAVLIGSFSGGTSDADPLLVTFNASANVTAVQAVVRNISYQNVGVDPSTLSRDVRFRVGDGDGGGSTAVTATVDLSGDATLVVTTANDTLDGDTSSVDALLANRGVDGEISLREAIAASNVNSDANTIEFDITGAGPHTIQLDALLPALVVSETLVIDGTTQTGFAGSPIIELDGSLTSGLNGLELAANASEIRGLVINRFDQNGILITGSGNTIAGNYLGTDVNGTSALVGNTQDGIQIDGDNNTIGGTTAADRNLISGNRDEGIDLNPGAEGNVIIGNYVGTDAAGTAAIGNGLGGSAWTGGILLDASNNTIGGNTAGERNLISGNQRYGVLLSVSATGNVIEGNYIGTDVSGTVDLGNTLYGVFLNDNGAADNTIGGTAAGAGNVIAYNDVGGIGLDPLAGTGNAILGNRIFANTATAIDLELDGVTANDALPGDADSGPNDLQNYPVLATAFTDNTSTVAISGTLNSTAGTTFRIEFFANTSGSAEGQRYLGAATVTTDGSGDASFLDSISAVVAAGEYVTATATVDLGGGSYGDTSEFSTAVLVTDTTLVSIAANDATAGEPGDHGQFTVDLGVPNSTGGPVTVSYSVGGSAAGGSDYTTLSGTVTVADGARTATIDVSVLDDGLFEGDQAVMVTLTGTTFPGAAIDLANDTATVTISDDDSRPTISINDAALVEGDAGTANLDFTVTRTGDAEANQTFNYSFTDMSTGAGDFVHTGGTVVFAQGENSKT
ncbi:MAG: DUF2341 domain-containing protein, partial [Gammaproteobacteria bacterium]|nr:DUF2341 domain-containing protein [Gammaproteobacteria bacterium]